MQKAKVEQPQEIVAIYARVSTSRQDGLMQIDELQEEAKKRGATVYKTYTDTITGSTKVAERQYAPDVIEDARAGRFTTLLVWRIDRLARDEEHGLNYIRQIEETGCKIKFLSNYGIDTPSTDNEEAASMIKTMRVNALMQARGEHMAIKSRNRAVVRNKLKYNRWPVPASPPYGYTCNRNTYQLEIDEQKAGVIRRIFRTYLSENKSTRQIAKILTDDGTPTATGRLIWSKDSPSKILRNQIYTGKTQLGNTLGKFDFICPPLVSLEDFEKVKEKAIERSTLSPRNLKRDYIFRGLLYCQRCSHILSPSTYGDKKYPGKKYHRYIGENKEGSKYKCHPRCGIVSEIKLAKVLLTHFNNFFNPGISERNLRQQAAAMFNFSPDLSIPEIRQEIKGIENKIKENQDRINAIKDDYYSGKRTQADAEYRDTRIAHWEEITQNISYRKLECEQLLLSRSKQTDSFEAFIQAVLTKRSLTTAPFRFAGFTMADILAATSSEEITSTVKEMVLPHVERIYIDFSKSPIGLRVIYKVNPDDPASVDYGSDEGNDGEHGGQLRLANGGARGDYGYYGGHRAAIGAHEQRGKRDDALRCGDVLV